MCGGALAERRADSDTDVRTKAAEVLGDLKPAELAAHAAQLVWFRRLFVVFSAYTYANRLVVIE